MFMLNHPTLEKLAALKLGGMLKALEEQRQMGEAAALSFEERLGLLVDREWTERENRRMTGRLAKARLRQAAALEDVDWRAPRGLDKSVVLALGSCQWIAQRHNCLITGPTGVGKSWLACALGHKACREGYSVLYLRLARLWRELAVSRGDGRYLKLLAGLSRMDLIILDDLGTEALGDGERHDLLEILEDRYERRSTLVTSQLPVGHWHEVIGDPTLADAILDRLVHNAHKLALKGESMRKKLTAPAGAD
jgi:DNA replication protein DnaC